MREIKFRGKRLLSEDWEYGNLIQRHDGGNFIETGDMRLCPVQDFSVGQFTGLHDKNGKDIYEGDIVHLDTWKPDAMQIAFIEGAFCLADANGYYLGDIHYIHHAEVEQCTVLGNIHDNPELMKGYKN